MENRIIVLVFLMVSSRLGATTSVTSSSSFNLMDYGAIGDGTSDDSQAFIKAWKAACKSYSGAVSIIIPEKTFMLKPSNFDGPCNPSHIYLQVFGNIVAPNNKSAWIGYHINTWLAFSKVNGLIISGQGQIDGQGSAWWPQPCLHDTPYGGAKCNGPTALTFNRCNGLQLNGLTHINSPRNHITLTNCKGVVISNLHIIAPQTSPNTDGIRISASNNVIIKNCIIETGDDCVAISGGSSNIGITGVRCGPGHGISIGALGHGGYDTVEDVHVQNCTFKQTMNGVRIKTWQGGNGYIRKISFEKIKLIEVNNPIIIDQYYCPSRVNCQNKTTAVQMSDISYSTIFGTSASDDAINLSCSQVNGCTNISLDYVYIASGTPGRTTYAKCFNAHGRFTHTKPAPKCLMI